jgi:hypothetical protein
MPEWIVARRHVVARVCLSVVAGALVFAGTAWGQATVTVGAPSSVLSNAHASATFPVTISRSSATSMLGFSVVFTASSNLSLPSGTGSIAIGGFLGSDGAPTTLQVRDLGGGQYAADGVTLGLPCGTTALTGTLFTVEVASSDVSGTGTITIDNVTLRDCSNATIASSIGSAGSVTIDHSVPSVSVTSPAGGERWLVGSSQSIGWTATDAEGFAPGAITLESSTDDGATWSPVASSQDNTGSSSWSVPAPVSSQARVRVTAVDQNGNTASATSNAFTVAKATTTTLGAVTSPSRFGDSVPLSATITFTPPGADAATGTITFYDGATSIATVSVASNGASTSTSSLAVGLHDLSAAYSGDALYDGSTSTTTALEVKAEIVATAGANGSISPPGATLYSLNATPSYTFAADPGYHVASVTVDGSGVALTSPYTFAPVSANHTIDVQFDVNPPVSPLAALTASTVRTGNGPSGVMSISTSWESIPVGAHVELYRAPFGNYPEYNSGLAPGAVPSIPGDPPGSPWVHVGDFTGTGTVDAIAARDFYYYVGFVVDQYGTRSAVSNRTGGTLDYALGDVTNGGSPGTGDNLVEGIDVSLLGSVYGRALVPGDAYDYLDVGPTTDNSVNGRPVTDYQLDFEDLVMFALNYGQVSSPASAVAGTPAARDELELLSPARVEAGAEFTVKLLLHGTGALRALSTTLGWDPAVAQPLGTDPGAALANGAGVALSPSPGVVDVAVLGAGTPGLTGEADLAAVRFRALRSGVPGVSLVRSDARDAANHHATVALRSAPAPLAVPSVTRLDAAVPSPFRERTTLGFALARPGDVELAVFSVDGRRVRTLVSGSRDAGEYHVVWDGRDDGSQPAAAGIYYLRLITPQGRFNRRLTLLH